MTSSTQMFDLITVLSAANLTPEQEKQLAELRVQAENLRSLETTAQGLSTANAVGSAVASVASVAGHGGARVSQFLTGVFNSLRK